MMLRLALRRGLPLRTAAPVRGLCRSLRDLGHPVDPQEHLSRDMMGQKDLFPDLVLEEEKTGQPAGWPNVSDAEIGKNPEMLVNHPTATPPSKHHPNPPYHAPHPHSPHLPMTPTALASAPATHTHAHTHAHAQVYAQHARAHTHTSAQSNSIFAQHACSLPPAKLKHFLTYILA